MKTILSSIRSCLVACLAVALLPSAGAQTAMSNSEPPGWYRMRLGQFEITALHDGTLQLPADKVFTKISSARIGSLLARAYLPNDVTLTVNAFLVNTGTKLVLIDTGTGTSPMFGPKLGSLLANLRASGYSPEQVDEIYVTHMHTDHIGGLTRDGQASFSNATVRANVREADFYLSQSRMNALPPEEREDFESAMADVQALLRGKQVQTLFRRNRAGSGRARDTSARTYARPHDLCHRKSRREVVGLGRLDACRGDTVSSTVRDGPIRLEHDAAPRSSDAWCLPTRRRRDTSLRPRTSHFPASGNFAPTEMATPGFP